MRRFAVAVVLAGLIAGGCGEQSKTVTQKELLAHAFREEMRINTYCLYGSLSQAQFDGCRRNVSYAYVEGSSSLAAQYAREPLNGCGVGSGPLCGMTSLVAVSKQAWHHYKHAEQWLEQ